MNIREWFGFKGEYDNTLGINACVDSLLELYSKAIKRYFSVHDAESYRAIQNLDVNGLSKGQRLFLNWLNEKGFPFLNELASRHLPDSEQLIAQIEYDKYILEEEMCFEYPDDVRSSLISIVNEVPEYIQAANEVSVSVSIEQLWDNWASWIPEAQVSECYVSEIIYGKIKENPYKTSNYVESASFAGSLLFLGGLI
ncbi:hypothetical protein ACIQY5_25550 [Peribacillus frigoritolerans]|uniref:hypothetical protein n=1 Tax=Peribacillus frigoritolerans TaxID=450367 RepID=UPI003809CDDC